MNVTVPSPGGDGLATVGQPTLEVRMIPRAALLGRERAQLSGRRADGRRRGYVGTAHAAASGYGHSNRRGRAAEDMGRVRAALGVRRRGGRGYPPQRPVAGHLLVECTCPGTPPSRDPAARRPILPRLSGFFSKSCMPVVHLRCFGSSCPLPAAGWRADRAMRRRTRPLHDPACGLDIDGTVAPLALLHGTARAPARRDAFRQGAWMRPKLPD